MTVTYQNRLDDLNKAFSLELNDKVLVAPFSDHFFSTRRAGISNKDAMRDHGARFQALKQTVLDFDLDLALQSGIYPAQWFSALDAKHYQWPGGDLPDDKTFQFIEKEYLLADEYDQFLANPTDFTFRVLWPRMTGKLAPLGAFPPLFSLGPDPIFLGPAFSYPENLAVLKSLVELAKAAAESDQAESAYVEEMKELGYPVSYQANFTPPFDIVADFLRGLKGTMLDMYRVPDRLLETTEKVIPYILRAALAGAQLTGVPFVFMPMHKGLDGFMSLEQFKTFFWPSLRKVILALIEEGLIPTVLWEGDCTSRLETIKNIPRGKAIYWFEKTDIFKAKEILGDTVCIRGNVPAAMLCVGSPAEVTDYCKKLVNVVGKGGGFILDGGTGIPAEAKPENVKAMADAIKDFGLYG